MNKISYLILLTTILFGFSQCGQSKESILKLQKETPFKIKEATYQEWVAGVRGGGSGISVVIIIDEESASKIEFDSLFFRGQKEKLNRSASKLVAHFKTRINTREDIILHINQQQEYGNQPPIIENSIPFELTTKESVISFKKKNKVKYVKILLTQIKSPLFQ